MTGIKRLSALPLLVLAACQTTPPAPPEPIMQTVEVPVRVACPSQEQVDRFANAEPPSVRNRLTGRSATDLPIVANSAVALREWGEGMLAVLQECAKVDPVSEAPRVME